MADRSALLTLAAAAGLLGTIAAARAITTAVPTAHDRPALLVVAADDDDKKPGMKASEKDEGEDKGEKKEKKEKIEQAVPMNMVPQAVIDAVMKECPGGKIIEAELQVKKKTIMYGFDVKVGDVTYDVNVTVDGKFYSKKVDAEGDEKAEKAEPAPADKK